MTFAERFHDYLSGWWSCPPDPQPQDFAVPAPPGSMANGPAAASAPAAGPPPQLPTAGHFYTVENNVRYRDVCYGTENCPDRESHLRALRNKHQEPANNCGFGEYLRRAHH